MTHEEISHLKNLLKNSEPENIDLGLHILYGLVETNRQDAKLLFTNFLERYSLFITGMYPINNPINRLYAINRLIHTFGTKHIHVKFSSLYFVISKKITPINEDVFYERFERYVIYLFNEKCAFYLNTISKNNLKK